jgi:hypothetical protein
MKRAICLAVVTAALCTALTTAAFADDTPTPIPPTPTPTATITPSRTPTKTAVPSATAGSWVNRQTTGAAIAAQLLVVTSDTDVPQGGCGMIVPASGSDKVFQATIGGTATVEAQGSLDGTTWSTIGSALTSSGSITDHSPWAFVRACATSYSSGSVTVGVGF